MITCWPMEISYIAFWSKWNVIYRGEVLQRSIDYYNHTLYERLYDYIKDYYFNMVYCIYCLIRSPYISIKEHINWRSVQGYSNCEYVVTRKHMFTSLQVSFCDFTNLHFLKWNLLQLESQTWKVEIASAFFCCTKFGNYFL